MNPDFFKHNPFPARPDDIMQDDNPPVSLNESQRIARSRAEDSRLKQTVLGLMSIFK